MSFCFKFSKFVDVNVCNDYFNIKVS